MNMFKKENQVQLIDIIKSDSSNDYERWVAACYLGDFGNRTSQKTVDTLIGLLNDRNQNVRCHAADSLGRIARSPKMKEYVVEHALEPLNRLLINGESLGAASAAKALGIINDRSAVKSLKMVLDDKKKWWQIRKNAATALGEIRDRRAVDSLVRALRDGYSSDVRISAVEALAKIKDPVAVLHLESILDDENINVRIAAQSAIEILKSI
jgi:HEAT repeat protein